MMRIALFTDGIYPIVLGGMQKHSYYLAKYLAGKGIDVDVYHAIPYGCQNQDLTDAFTKEELKHLQFIPIHFPKYLKFPGHYIWESYIYSKRIYLQFVKRQAVDFIYVQGFAGWCLLKNRRKDAKRLRKNNNIPVGVNFHGLNMYQRAANFRCRLEQKIFRPFVKYNLIHSDFIFSLGGKLTTIQSKISHNNQIVEIPIGINSNWIMPTLEKKTTNKIQLVFVGRYERLKGIEELNSVLSELLITHPNTFTIHFIGPIPEAKQLRTTSGIVYHGAIREEGAIKRILNDSDVLLCPSWSEGMPTVILEAMACGCAIVATDVGAVRDQVSDENGILINPGDKIQLKQAILQMIGMEKSELHHMQQASIDKVKKHFIWDNIIEKTIKAINQISIQHQS